MVSEKLQEILEKDGRNWTVEESELVLKAIKKHGHSVLKRKRQVLRGK